MVTTSFSATQDITIKAGSPANLITKTSGITFTSGAITAVTRSGAVLIAIRERVRNKSLFFLEEGDEELWVDVKILGGAINNMSGSLVTIIITVIIIVGI